MPVNPNRSPEQRFRIWVFCALALGVLMFAYFILADLNMPLSPEARLTNLVTQISPEVSGKVVGIHVRNNQHVSRSQVLFSIDPRTFSQSVEEARLQLEASDQDNHLAGLTRPRRPTGFDRAN